HTGNLNGVKHFALWPLAQAARSCFGSDEWPADVPTPAAWIEFDVRDIESATSELKLLGYRLLVEMRQEPWGQTATRLLSPEGLLVGITCTPSLRPSAGNNPGGLRRWVLGVGVLRHPGHGLAAAYSVGS
ncbi:MAG TPA: hypothetical protein VMI31_12275, partial [Fimbriimonadaceae bacterium]|nr:hypothetical protein [Fimbriimonadaceae bacterium]